MEEAITFWLDNKICSGFKVSRDRRPDAGVVSGQVLYCRERRGTDERGQAAALLKDINAAALEKGDERDLASSGCRC